MLEELANFYLGLGKNNWLPVHFSEADTVTDMLAAKPPRSQRSRQETRGNDPTARTEPPVCGTNLLLPQHRAGKREPELHCSTCTLRCLLWEVLAVFFSRFVRWFVLNVFRCWPTECCCLVLYFPVRKGKAPCLWCLARASLVPEDPVTFTAASATWARGNGVPSISTATATTAPHQELQAAFTACMSTSKSGHPSDGTYSNTQSCSPCAI